MNTGVYIGRFQPLHTGHLAIIKQGIKNENTFVVIIGSIDKYDSKNLYSFQDRKNFRPGSKKIFFRIGLAQLFDGRRKQKGYINWSSR